MSRLAPATKLLIYLFFAAFFLVMSHLALAAQPSQDEPWADSDAPVLINADELAHDRDLGIVTARGHVEVSRDSRVLLADAVTYNTKQDTVTASGNVSMVEPDGNVMFADYFEVSGDLKRGFSRQVYILLADRSRLAATTATRVAGVKNELSRAVYSACRQCETDPERPPLWQIKAMRIIHDEILHEIEYRDAWLEMSGIPVIYTPYLSHADPTVKRHSGFLVPSIGSSTALGPTVRTPYFWAISPNADLTVDPIITANERAILAAEYRGKYTNGEATLSGSVTQDSSNTFRGHVLGRAKIDIDNIWRSDLQIERASDDTYMRRYRFGSDPWLTSRATIEGFNNRSYASAQAFSFQGQRLTGTPATEPFVLPLLDYNYVGEPAKNGGYLTMDANALVLQRKNDSDSRRISLRTGWTLPYTGPAGDIYKLTTSIRGDGYYVGNKPLSNGDTYSGFTGRFHPEAALEWRYPFVREGEGVRDVLEPITAVIISPNGGNPNRIPNIDSRNFEFDDTNLFSSNRFTGLDRVETGQRVNYGLNWSSYGSRRIKTNAMFGQSYRLHPDRAFGSGSGVEDNFSDYVGRVDARAGDQLAALYRYRLNKDNFAPSRNELGVQVGPKTLQLTTSYIMVKHKITEGAEFGDREEIDNTLSSALTRHVTVSATTKNDLTPKGGFLSVGGRAAYEDECFIFAAEINHEYTNDRDIEAGTSVLFHVVLKTLGQLQTGI